MMELDGVWIEFFNSKGVLFSFALKNGLVLLFFSFGLSKCYIINTSNELLMLLNGGK